MTMRAAGPANQQPAVSGAPPNQVAQSGQAQPQGPILRLPNPGANPQLRSLLLSQQQPVSVKKLPEKRTLLSKPLPCLCPSCISVLAAGGRVPHVQHDVSPRPGTAAGPPDTRRGRSNARPVEAATGRLVDANVHVPSLMCSRKRRKKSFHHCRRLEQMFNKSQLAET